MSMTASSESSHSSVSCGSMSGSWCTNPSMNTSPRYSSAWRLPGPRLPSTHVRPGWVSARSAVFEDAWPRWRRCRGRRARGWRASSAGLPCGMYADGVPSATSAARRAAVQPAERGGEERAHPAFGDAVLGGDDERVAPRVGEHLRSAGMVRMSHTVACTSRASSSSAASSAASTILPTARMHTSSPARTLRARAARGRPRRRHVTCRGLRPAQRDRTRRDAQRLRRASPPTSSYDDGANTVRPGHLGEEREVVETVVARAVVAGDAGAVDAEHHRERRAGRRRRRSGPTRG